MASDKTTAPAGAIDAAWRAYRDTIERLRKGMFESPLARDAVDQARAQHWLMQAEAAAYNLVIAPQRSHTAFLIDAVFQPNLYSWLMPNADFLYRYAFVDGARNYRISGRRGGTHFLEAQAISGFWGDPQLKLLRTYDLDEFERAADGAFEIHVGPSPADCPNWIATDPSNSKNTLIIREAFYDWGSERRSELRIDQADFGEPPGQRDEVELSVRLAAACRMVEFCFKTFSGRLTETVLDKVGTNRFLLVDTSKDEHASNPSAGYVPAVYELAPGQALIVEVAPPKARYWNIHLGDVWWQVTDYTNRQSSLNGRQAKPDADGKFRIVISAQDPGVANWLDTAGIMRGVALLRWYFSDAYPAPTTRLVPFERVLSELPPETETVGSEARRDALAARRRAVLARYGQ
ncbi:MAG TPA: DUF1214 domain-containing protein [Alphaproteobacteria bacterium]|nr:DUF1214 domain-containing protein [Alphaproteobacteria bacterium]